MRRRRRERRSQKQSVRRGSGGHLFYSESIRELFLSETFFVKPKKILHSLVICPHSYFCGFFNISRQNNLTEDTLLLLLLCLLLLL